jgi:hypothetical protein
MSKWKNHKLYSALALTTALLLALTSMALAAVWTDQQDYFPGSPVTISGDNSNGVGYVPGNSVHVDVAGPNEYTSACDATVDDAGAWSCQVILWDSDLAVGEYTYTASSLASDGFTPISETGTFTDAKKETITSLASNPNPSNFNGSITFTASISAGTDNINCGTVDFKEGSTIIGTGSV